MLTKRIGNVRHMLPDDWGDGYKNVWLGATIANQEEADRDIVKLLRIPAFVHFLSCEPLLGPIRFDRRHAHCSVHDYEGGFCTGPCPHLVLVDWVIVGGESGPKARHMPEEWARSIRDQCDSAGISFFMKQMTKKAPIPTDLLMRDFPKVAA